MENSDHWKSRSLWSWNNVMVFQSNNKASNLVNNPEKSQFINKISINYESKYFHNIKNCRQYCRRNHIALPESIGWRAQHYNALKCNKKMTKIGEANDWKMASCFIKNVSWKNTVWYLKFNAFDAHFLIYRWAWHLLVLTKRYRDVVPKATGVCWFWARTGPRRSKSRYFDGQAWTCHFKHILALDDNILFLAIQAGCTIWPWFHLPVWAWSGHGFTCA